MMYRRFTMREFKILVEGPETTLLSTAEKMARRGYIKIIEKRMVPACRGRKKGVVKYLLTDAGRRAKQELTQ